MNHLEKYLEINKRWPEMAGKFMQLSRAQRRMIEGQMKVKNLTPAQKELLVGHAELIEVGDALIVWVHAFLQDVVKDAEALKDSAKLREELKFAQEVCTEYIK